MQQLIKQFSCQNLQNKWKGEIRLDQYNSPVGVGFDELESGNAIVSPQGVPIVVFILVAGVSVLVAGTIAIVGAFVSVAVGVNQVVDTYG